MDLSPTGTSGGQPAAEIGAPPEFCTDLRRPPNIFASISDVLIEADEIEARTLDSVHRLVERAKEGDTEAFGELYRRYHPPLFRLARASLGEGAEDAVAETFMRAWRALPGYRDTGAPFVAWLYGVARHVIADEFRRRARVEPRADLPDRRVEWAVEDKLTLAAAIRRLPDEQRQVVELKFLMGATNAEVAATLGKSVDAVNAKQWRALAALRKTLEEQ
jgi:RNA polymerase sigma-70 factor (ECF subfamily)